MLTMSPDTVDGQGLWMTVSDLSRAKGVSKQAISKRIDRLEAQGLLESRQGPRNTKLVNVAQYDRAAGEATDAVRELNGTGAVRAQAYKPDEGDPILAKQQARRAAYEADLKGLDLNERLGKLLAIEDVEAAMVRCAEAVVRKIDQLPMKAEDNAAAVARDGVQGARGFLRNLARELRLAFEVEMRLLESEPSAPSAQVEA